MSDIQQVTEGGKPLPEGYYLQLLVTEDSTDLLDLWEVLKNGRLLIFIILALFLALGTALSFVLPRNYAAEVVVSSTDAGLVNKSSGRDSSDSVDLSVVISGEEALAMIESRIFINQFIEQEKLLPVIYEKRWDKVKKQWKPGQDVPTKWEVYEKFSDDMLDLMTDAETGLTTVTVKWTNASQAAHWANEIIKKINIQLRDRAISEAETSISYLNEQLAKTSAVELQQALYDLMKVQLAKIVAAKVHEEFAFRVVDPALVPEEPAIPHLLAILLVVSAFFGTGIGMSLVWFRHSLRQMAAKRKTKMPVT